MKNTIFMTLRKHIQDFSTKQRIAYILVCISLCIIGIVFWQWFGTKSHLTLFRSEEKGYQFSYDARAVLLQENGYGVKLNTADTGGKIVSLTISNNPAELIPYPSYTTCSSGPRGFHTPCIYAKTITDTTLGNLPAKSFIITFGEKDPDNQIIDYEIIQTEKPLLIVKIRTLRKTVHDYFKQILTTFTFIPEKPALRNTSGLITYHSTGGKYSVQVPAGWFVSSQETTAMFGDIAFDPEDEIGVHLNGITISLQQASANDRIWNNRYANDTFTQRTMTDTQIAGYKALVKYQIHKNPPLTGKAIDWYNGPDKETHLYINDKQTIVFQAKWDIYKPQYEAAMDAIVASFQLDK